MNQDQIDSLVRTCLKMVGGILVAHGAQQMATTVTSPAVIEAVIGIVTAGLSIYASHKSNAPVVPPKP